MYTPQLSQMHGDSIRLAKKRLDSSTVDHSFSQLLNGGGEATGMKFQLESVPPCLETEPAIGGFWVSYPEKFGSALVLLSASHCER